MSYFTQNNLTFYQVELCSLKHAVYHTDLWGTAASMDDAGRGVCPCVRKPRHPQSLLPGSWQRGRGGEGAARAGVPCFMVFPGWVSSLSLQGPSAGRRWQVHPLGKAASEWWQEGGPQRHGCLKSEEPRGAWSGSLSHRCRKESSSLKGTSLSWKVRVLS